MAYHILFNPASITEYPATLDIATNRTLEFICFGVSSLLEVNPLILVIGILSAITPDRMTLVFCFAAKTESCAVKEKAQMPRRQKQSNDLNIEGPLCNGMIV